MPRKPRLPFGDQILHILNRKDGDGVLFDTTACHRKFLHFVAESAAIDRIRILAYCLMPNHWHMLVWPHPDGDVSGFVRRFTMRHTYDWHCRHHSKGRGHLYQGRFKSSIILDDAYLLTACRYVERNPVRAGLADTVAEWTWSSAAARLAELHGSPDPRPAPVLPLAPLPVALPTNWETWVNLPQSASELSELRACIQRGLPIGAEEVPDAEALGAVHDARSFDRLR